MFLLDLSLKILHDNYVAKVKKKSTRPIIKKTPSGFRFADPKTLIFLVILLIGIVITVIAAINPTEIRKQASRCDTSNCNQCLNNGNYMIVNMTNCPAEPDGDIQLCSFTGRVGLCGGSQWCCPGPGQQWTQNMAACAGQVYSGPCIAPVTPTNTPRPTNTPGPTNTPRPTNTPYPTSTPRPTNTPYPTSTPRPTSTPYPTSTRYPTQRPQPTNTPYIYSTATPKPTITLTPTPTPLLVDVCGKSCVTDADCKLGLGCTTIFATLRACRNKSCPDKTGCTCGDGSGLFVFATPTPGPGSETLRSLLLTVGGFADNNHRTNDTPTVFGTAEPDSKVTVTVYPDGIGGEVYADKNGKWSYKFTKKLTPGAKNLLVVATKPDGQAQVAQQFTVVAGPSINPFGIVLIIMILAALGFGAYVYVKSNQ